MVTIRPELPCDAPCREALLDQAFGKRRYRKTSQRLRDGRLPAEGLAFSAVDEVGRLIGTVRLWNIHAGAAGASLLLGPVAVNDKCQNRGIGSALVGHAVAKAKEFGHRSIILVGDLSYYDRFGFGREAATELRLPGPVDQERLLGLELVPDSLREAKGLVTATGRFDSDTASRRRATA